MITLLTDILITIAAYLDLGDLRRFFKVCRRLKELDCKRLWMTKLSQVCLSDKDRWQFKNRLSPRGEYIDALVVYCNKRTFELSDFYTESIDTCDKEAVEIMFERLCWHQGCHHFRLIEYIIDSNNIHMLTWVCRFTFRMANGFDFTYYAIYAGKKNNLLMLKYLLLEGCERRVDLYEVMIRVAVTDNLEVMKYLEDIRIAKGQGSYASSIALYNTISGSGSRVFSWILQNLQYEESPKFRREFENLIESTSMGRSDKNRLRELLEYADRHQMKLDLSTPLWNAIHVSRADLVKILCNHGAKITTYIQKVAGYKMDAIRSCMKPEWFDCT